MAHFYQHAFLSMAICGMWRLGCSLVYAMGVIGYGLLVVAIKAV